MESTPLTCPGALMVDRGKRPNLVEGSSHVVDGAQVNKEVEVVVPIENNGLSPLSPTETSQIVENTSTDVVVDKPSAGDMSNKTVVLEDTEYSNTQVIMVKIGNVGPYILTNHLSKRGLQGKYERLRLNPTVINDCLVLELSWSKQRYDSLYASHHDNLKIEVGEGNQEFKLMSFVWCLPIMVYLMLSLLEILLGFNLYPGIEVGSKLSSWQKVRLATSRGRIQVLRNKINSSFSRHTSEAELQNLKRDKEELHLLLNKEEGLLDKNGICKEGKQDIKDIAVNYFKDLFSSASTVFDDSIIGAIDMVITDEMNGALCADFTTDEIIVAFLDIHLRKAPSIDGTLDMSLVNKTVIVLIPKISDPQQMKHLRPISLCTVIYKIVSKVLVRRLKGLMASCSHETQAAFLLGRQISDNILVAHELIHYINSSKNGPNKGAAIKLDMEKACVETVSFSVRINGSLTKEFRRLLLFTMLLVLMKPLLVKSEVSDLGHYLGDANRRGWPMVAWKTMCKPKREDGMGFWDLYSFNLALLGKQLWLFSKEDTMQILSDPIIPCAEDVIVWANHDSGIYSVRSSYLWLQKRHHDDKRKSKLWLQLTWLLVTNAKILHQDYLRDIIVGMNKQRVVAGDKCGQVCGGLAQSSVGCFEAGFVELSALLVGLRMACDMR
ncbi:hypothetical protein F3Y22_tig00110858pilonHSYRG00023 [Hibiscus syriacus]|uniref:Uncharacterized protein n=1 Tax=Hibiscus syriacus TaxID=106335 RepID=A0A6A2ZKL2_HIBSY|nr:hypothetical protein F3Y22_tig00110858pilonHSYRG00023 [Hibiscus syriacus]